MPPAKPAVTDAAILAKLDETAGNVTRTAKELRVRKGRVVAVNRAAGNPAAGKKAGTVFEAAEGAVLHLAEVIGGMGKRDAGDAHRLAVLYGVVVDKYLLLANRPTQISQQQPAAATFDFTRLTRAELNELCRLHDKVNGVEYIQVSDLNNPVVYSDTEPDCIEKNPVFEPDPD